MNSQVTLGYKLTEVGVIPEDWTVRPLRELTTEVGDGIHSTPIYSRNGEYFFINGNNLQDGRVFISDETKSVSYSEFKKHRKNLGDNSILMSINGTIGNLGLFSGEPIILGKSAAYLNLKNELSRLFVYYALQSDCVKTQFSDGLTGTTIKNLGLGTIRDTGIPLPGNLIEQCGIATALSDMDALISGLDKLIAKKREIKQATMQQLLTGQKRLPGFSGEWDYILVSSVTSGYFSGPSPTCLERNIYGSNEWGVLKTTAATKEYGWDWKKHKTLPEAYWGSNNIELQAGDVIVTKAGPRHRVGVAVSIDYTPRRLIPSGKMITLRPNRDRVVPLMLAAAISAKDAQIYLDQRSTGMAESQVNFENSDLLSTPIRIPSIIEQEAIACVLSDMDAELTVLEARRDKARQLKQGMMQELLTGRIRLP